VSCSIFLTLCLFVQYFILCGEGINDTCFWKKDVIRSHVFMEKGRLASFTLSGTLTAVPMFIFGYNCQPNVFPIYLGLKAVNSNSKTKKMNKVFKRSLMIGFVMYIIAGSSGFLIFLENTNGNILLNNFKKSPDILVASFMFTVAMILAAPAFVNSIREKIYGLLWRYGGYNIETKLFVDCEKCSDSGTPNKCSVCNGRGDIVKTSIHALITFGIVAICISISVSVTDIATIIGWIGSTTNPITGYVLPTYFVWKLVPTTDIQSKSIGNYLFISAIMVFVVICVSVGSVYLKIADLL